MTEPAPAENQEKLLQQFADVPDESGRREFLSRNPVLLRPEIVTALADQAREKIRVDVQQALRLATRHSPSPATSTTRNLWRGACGLRRMFYTPSASIPRPSIITSRQPPGSKRLDRATNWRAR